MKNKRKKQPTPLWTVRIPLSDADREELKRYAREVNTTSPHLVAAILQKVLHLGLRHFVQEDQDLHQRYSRVSEEGEHSEIHTVYEQMGLDVPDRSKHLEKVISMFEWPGDFLDEDCSEALETWLFEWGELTIEELSKLDQARSKREEALLQWQQVVNTLETEIAELSEQEQSKPPRMARTYRVRRLSRERELKDFKLKVQWSRRVFPEKKQGAPEDALL